MTESHLDVGGAVVFWAAADGADRLALRDALDGLGLGRLAPDPRPPAAALRDALESSYAGPRTLVRPLADRDGFAVVQEDRGASNNDYRTVVTARVLAGDPPGLVLDPVTGRAGEVGAAFRAALAGVPAAQLSACLVRAVAALGGTRLRPGGAVYWVPGPRLADWADVARAVECAGTGKPTAVYSLRHRLDADAVRAVRDAVVAEVRADADRIQADVLAGDLGGRALEARARQAADLRAKVLLYEDVLSVGLAGLHAAVDAADQAAATAALLLHAAPAGVP